MRVYYHLYIESPKWAANRETRRLMDGGRCVRCRSEDHLQCHHLHYRLLGREEVDGYRSIVTVCRDCHRYIHGRSSRDPAQTTTLRELWDRLN